jgi:hypothetical protein
MCLAFIVRGARIQGVLASHASAGQRGLSAPGQATRDSTGAVAHTTEGPNSECVSTTTGKTEEGKREELVQKLKYRHLTT